MKQSLHEEHGSDAPVKLQGIMQGQVGGLSEDFVVENKGNHYIVSKDGESMRVPSLDTM